MENFLLSNKDFINNIVGVIYEMHPYHKPEGIDKIVDAIQAYFNSKISDIEKKKRFKLIRFTDEKEAFNELKTLLMSIKEFTNYNISKALQDKGVEDYNHPRNSGTRFTDMYTEDPAYTDFIDLDACIRNIFNQMISSKELEEDCFLCKYAKEYGSMEPGDERCKTCLCNRTITFKRENHPLSIKPKKDWTEEEKKLYSLE